MEDEAAVPVDPDDDVPETVGTVLATVVVVPVLDAALPVVVDVDDVTPPVERSCPRIVRRDCSSASSADGLLLETPDPVVAVEDVPEVPPEDVAGSVVVPCVTAIEAPPVEDVDGGAGSVVVPCVTAIEAPPVEDVDGGVGSVVVPCVTAIEAPPAEDVDGGAGSVVVPCVTAIEAPPVEDVGGAGGVWPTGCVAEDPPVEPLVPAPA